MVLGNKKTKIEKFMGNVRRKSSVARSRTRGRMKFLKKTSRPEIHHECMTRTAVLSERKSWNFSLFRKFFRAQILQLIWAAFKRKPKKTNKQN